MIPKLPRFTFARRRRDYRPLALVAIAASVAILGYFISLAPGRGVAIDRTPGLSAASPFTGLLGAAVGSGKSVTTVETASKSEPSAEAYAHIPEPARTILAAARKSLGQSEFDLAIRHLDAHRTELRPYAETYMLLGAALEAKQEFALSRDFYNAALERDPYMADAHFGYAVTSEALGDLESALSGMRSYLHTEPDLDPNRLQVAQARSAIWEWEAKIGRGPWGPTRGVPPGFSETELKRDGRGVGIKIPIPGTEQPDGSMQYEIKAQDKFQMFKP